MISQDMLVTHMLCHALTTVNQKRIVCTLEYFFWVMPGLFVKFQNIVKFQNAEY